METLQYTVQLSSPVPSCDRDWDRHCRPCKHMLAVVQKYSWELMPLEYRQFPCLWLMKRRRQWAVRHVQWGVDSVPGYVEKMKSLHPVVRSMFGQAEQLLRLLLTTSCSNVEAERSFMCLRRVKTYLRNTMGQRRHAVDRTSSTWRARLMDSVWRGHLGCGAEL